MEVVSSDSDTSEDEHSRNTVGRIPMEWYDEYEHIGYDLDGKKVSESGTVVELKAGLILIASAIYSTRSARAARRKTVWTPSWIRWRMKITRAPVWWLNISRITTFVMDGCLDFFSVAGFLLLVYDPVTGKEIVLTDEDVALIKKIQVILYPYAALGNIKTQCRSHTSSLPIRAANCLARATRMRIMWTSLLPRR